STDVTIDIAKLSVLLAEPRKRISGQQSQANHFPLRRKRSQYSCTSPDFLPVGLVLSSSSVFDSVVCSELANCSSNVAPASFAAAASSGVRCNACRTMKNVASVTTSDSNTANQRTSGFFHAAR